MSQSVKLNRRSFLAANAALAATSVVPATAATSAASSVTTSATAAPLAWHSVTSDALNAFVGDRFRVKTEDGDTLVLRLVAVEPFSSGPDRPVDLPRSEGLIAVFDSPDKACLVDCGHKMHRVSHPNLGSAHLFMGPSQRRNGDHVLEMVLN